ncbi:uncharacterized protein BO88DRAFT_417782 [Aspergillus vadensis CBS 113365]|uniref:Uncharacterized protein n=1 Tax=Aspergillus vadensis (strain CBS 113365 / IMI 142717 / IBT 24658) TaxID=1448311 RepID=A0A319B2J4_ASPVC|nr:hypothetical protein BO88DRAFT_417782 [Aspergillus vadensis CBS 113365]PYH66064.1 hypothetical protein BO88DRAFT_417782 [Aspergillus vadensis CBS 113365]
MWNSIGKHQDVTACDYSDSKGASPWSCSACVSRRLVRIRHKSLRGSEYEVWTRHGFSGLRASKTGRSRTVFGKSHDQPGLYSIVLSVGCPSKSTLTRLAKGPRRKATHCLGYARGVMGTDMLHWHETTQQSVSSDTYCGLVSRLVNSHLTSD